MSKRYIPIAVVTAMLAVLAVIGYVWPASEPLLPVKPLPNRVLLKNSAGKVVFDHKKHFEDYKVECQSCHHDREKPTPVAQACSSCHGVVTTPNFKTEHVTAFADQMSCVTCHHVEFAGTTYEGPDRTPDSTWDHTPHLSAGGDMKQCNTCHDFVNTKTTLRDKGWITINPAYADCTVCHRGQEIEDLIPSRMQAFHDSCMGCHEKLDKGPYGQETCNQCHTK